MSNFAVESSQSYPEVKEFLLQVSMWWTDDSTVAAVPPPFRPGEPAL